MFINMAAWFASWAGETLISKILVTFFISILPVVELRGALPLGISIGLDHWTAYLVSVAGNMLPVPFIVIFMRRVMDWLRSKSPRLDRIVQKIVDRTLKHEKALYRSEILGLIIFVAIPLPGTGAWTGAMLAALMNIRMKVAFPAIAVGVIIAGFLVMGISLGFETIFA